MGHKVLFGWNKPSKTLTNHNWGPKNCCPESPASSKIGGAVATNSGSESAASVLQELEQERSIVGR